MAALFQVGKCRGGIRYTSCSGYCTSQLDSQLHGKRRTRTRNISDIVLCIYRILHGKYLVRYLRTLRSLVTKTTFWYQNNEYVNTVQGTFHVVLRLLYTYRDIQHFASFFISKLSNPKIAKISRYTPRNDKEKTLRKNYNLGKDMK